MPIIAEPLHRKHKRQRQTPNTDGLFRHAPRRPAPLALILLNVLLPQHIIPQRVHHLEGLPLLSHGDLQGIERLPAVRDFLALLAGRLLVKHAEEHVDEGTVLLRKGVLPRLQRPMHQHFLWSCRGWPYNPHIHLLNGGFVNGLQQEEEEFVTIVAALFRQLLVQCILHGGRQLGPEGPGTHTLSPIALPQQLHDLRKGRRHHLQLGPPL